jgi:hypothetical protein
MIFKHFVNSLLDAGGNVGVSGDKLDKRERYFVFYFECIP